ncbi:hypothetical protein [Bacillus cereus]|nr:hypothetical protein [Bacillus cereus]
MECFSKLSEEILNLRGPFCRGFSWSKRYREDKNKINYRKDT